MSAFEEMQAHFDELDDENIYDDPDDGSCTMCGGEGYGECDDPIQCTSPHTRGGDCPCGACGGSGDAKDQTIW